MPYELGDYLRSINDTKEQLITNDIEESEKKYLPYIVNRCLSYFVDTIMFANMMNMHPFLDKKLQFDFLINIVRKRKRFRKWDKKDDPVILKVVKEYYDLNDEKAKQIINILSPDQLNYIQGQMERGGKQ